MKWHWNHAYKTFHRVVEVHNTRVRVTINQQSNSNSNLNLNCLFNIGMLKARDWERYYTQMTRLESKERFKRQEISLFVIYRIHHMRIEVHIL